MPDDEPPTREARPSHDAGSQTRSYTIVVQRQDALEKPETRREEHLQVEATPQTSVLSALSRASQNVDNPVTYEGDCFEGVCGGCTMLINGRVKLACTTSLARAADKKGRVKLRAMTSFPLLRDLVVDRDKTRRTARRVALPTLVDPTEQQAHRRSPAATLEFERLDECIECGACLEACPQYGEHKDFVGPQLLHQVDLRNRMPHGERDARHRLEAIMAPGGIAHCGKAQNCVEVCPVGIPLFDSIQNVARATSRQLLVGWLFK